MKILPVYDILFTDNLKGRRGASTGPPLPCKARLTEMDMERLLKSIYENPKKTRLLRLASTVCAYIGGIFYALGLLLLLLRESYTEAVVSASFAAAGFLLVTAVRKLINKPRPYEVYDFYTVPPREKRGQSFPSRHSYSAFAIAALSALVSPALCVGTAVLAVIIAVCRVLTGMHFLRDVLCGGALGLFFGGAGIILTLII